MAMAMARRLFGLARFDATTQMRKKSQSQSGSKKIAKIEHLLPVKIALVLETTGQNYSDSDRQKMFNFCNHFRSVVALDAVELMDLWALYLRPSMNNLVRVFSGDSIVNRGVRVQ